MPKISRVRYAVYDPVTKKFGGLDKLWHVCWSDKFDSFNTYASPTNAMGLQKRTNVPSVIVEITQTMEWADSAAAVPFDITQTAKFIKHKAIYDRLLPAYEADADAMPKKDWTAFKAARQFLKEAGVLNYRMTAADI